MKGCVELRVSENRRSSTLRVHRDNTQDGLLKSHDDDGKGCGNNSYDCKNSAHHNKNSSDRNDFKTMITVT